MTFAKGKTAHIYIRVTDMKDNTIKLSDLKYIDDYVYEHIKNYTINASDLYLTIAGTIGSVGIVPNEVDGMNLTENAAKLTQIGCIKEYLLYALLSTIAQEHFISRFHQVAQPKLSIETASKTPIAMPPIGEQIRIVKEIKRYLAAIKIIEEGQTDLETTISQTKSKILDLAIHGKLVPQDPTDEPATELLKRINPNAEITSDNGHYQKLPEGWVITSISEMCENINGLWKGKKEPFVKVGVIRNANFTKDFKLDYSKIEYIDVEERAFKKRHLLNGDLIVEKSGGSDNTPVGRAILYEGKDAIFSFSNFTMVLRIHYKDVLSYKYLYYYIMSKYQKGEMRLMQTQTTGLHNLILDKYLDIPLCLPPYQEQQRIINKIEETFGVLDLIMENL